MTTNEITIELRRIAQRMAALAERLDNMTIGVQPIAKRDAAAELSELRMRVQRLADTQVDDTDIEGRPRPLVETLAAHVVDDLRHVR